MGTYDRLDKTAGLDSLQLTVTNAVDEDLFALISSLIEQNAELMQKVQELNSQKELANSVVTEAHKQEETIKLFVEMEARDRASAIIKEAETKARIEADKVLAEAKQEAEEIRGKKTQFAIKQALLIVATAQEKALSILDDVRKQAEEITGMANHKVKR
jgi:vacuolar-type H+-ATPase subunit H